MPDFELILPKYIITTIPTELVIVAGQGIKDLPEEIVCNGEVYSIIWEKQKGRFSPIFKSGQELSVVIRSSQTTIDINPIPIGFSIFPPILAILLALLIREVLLALFFGIFSGATILHFYNEGWTGLFSGFLAVIDTYILKAMQNQGNLSVILFSLLIGGLVALISKNGGMQGVVNLITPFARTPQRAQFSIWGLGIGIFFDDYANTLVVGNTMRPIADRFRISREKLSFLVDSTAAPVASIAFITTWIGAEIGYIQNEVEKINANGEVIQEGAYAIFTSSLQYAFYPIFMLAFMFLLIWKKRDYGPMWKAEQRARETGMLQQNVRIDSDDTASNEMKPAAGIRPKWWNAAIPIAVMIFGTAVGLLYSGWNSENWNNEETSLFLKLSSTIGSSDSYAALLWASLSALACAVALTWSQRILSIDRIATAVISGFKSMVPAIIVLVLAWSLALLTEEMHTASFIANSLGTSLSPSFLPAITFVLAALVAFSTGSSWGTMAILYPIVLSTSWDLCTTYEMSHLASMAIFYNVVSAVLAGSVLGDHCSPLSDTTILSSLACQCHHMDHVKTQIPYALTVGAIAVFIGTLPSSFGLPSWIGFLIGFAALYFVVQFVGKPIKEIQTHSDKSHELGMKKEIA